MLPFSFVIFIIQRRIFFYFLRIAGSFLSLIYVPGDNGYINNSSAILSEPYQEGIITRLAKFSLSLSLITDLIAQIAMK